MEVGPAANSHLQKQLLRHLFATYAALVLNETYVLFLNGAYGVGKSATLDHIGDLLAQAGRPFSLMDVDWYHRSWPPHIEDPQNVLTEADNMAAVWTNYRKAGPRQPVVAGVIASHQDRERYQKVFDLPARLIRLTASSTVTAARLRRRYTEHQSQALHWHLERHEAVARDLAQADLDELVVDTDHASAHVVAEQVLRHLGLLDAEGNSEK